MNKRFKNAINLQKTNNTVGIKKTHFRKNTKKTKDITIIQFYVSSIFIRESDRT